MILQRCKLKVPWQTHYMKSMYTCTQKRTQSSSKAILSHSHDWRRVRSSPHIFRASSAEQRQISDVTEQLIYQQWFISEGSDQHRRRGIKLRGTWWTTVAWGSWLRNSPSHPSLRSHCGGVCEKDHSVSQTWKKLCPSSLFYRPTLFWRSNCLNSFLKNSFDCKWWN